MDLSVDGGPRNIKHEKINRERERERARRGYVRKDVVTFNSPPTTDAVLCEKVLNVLWHPDHRLQVVVAPILHTGGRGCRR